MEKMNKGGGECEVVDGWDIMKLVGNEEVFSNFRELDKDCDGELSVRELQPPAAVADIAADLGLPVHASSPQSHRIYSEVLNECTHGNRQEVSKPEFKEFLSDILLGMAAGLNRDPVVILRMDGEDLMEFVRGPGFEPEILSVLSEIDLPDGQLQDYITKALEKLSVVQGMPPASDPWVTSNIVEPVLQSCVGIPQQPFSEEAFLVEFKKVAESIAQRLKEQPAIVAHSENTFDGSGIKRLLSSKFELDKTLDSAVKALPRDRHGKISKEYWQVALDSIASSAGLPPAGAVEQMDKITSEAFKMMEIDDGQTHKEEEDFKKLLTEVLGSIMLQLQGNPVSVSTDAVVHEPISSSSTLLQPPSSP